MFFHDLRDKVYPYKVTIKGLDQLVMLYGTPQKELPSPQSMSREDNLQKLIDFSSWEIIRAHVLDGHEMMDCFITPDNPAQNDSSITWLLLLIL